MAIGASLIVAVALTRSPLDTPTRAEASQQPPDAPSAVARSSGSGTVITGADLTLRQQAVVDGITIADVDESTVRAGYWAVVSGDGGWVSTDLRGQESSIRATGRWLAAASAQGDQWIVGLVDRSTGRFEPYATMAPPGAWWVQASASRTGKKIIAMGSGSRDGTAVDLGVVVIDVATSDALVLTPVAPTKGFRSELEWSATGDSVASSDCDMEGCRVDIVTGVEGSAPKLISIDGLTPLAIGDRFLLGTDQRIDHRWRTIDLADPGDAVAIDGSIISGAFDGYEAVPGRFILSGRTEDGGFAIETFDATTRKVDVVFLQNVDDLSMVPLSQDPRLVTLTGRGGIVDVINGRSSIGLVDLESGTFTKDALAVQPS